jgi:glycosyltransferase involved in cell wall biosynthesis
MTGAEARLRRAHLGGIISGDPMRILFITGLTGYGIGGARTEEVKLVRGMAERGHVVAMTNDVLPPELSGIRHFHIDYPPRSGIDEQMSAAVAAFKPDLVHAAGGGVRFLRACDQALAGRRWVFTTHNLPPSERIFKAFHGNEYLHYRIRNLIAKPSVWASCRFLKTSRYARAICHSQSVADRLRDYGCAAEKIRQIPFGSELPAVELNSDSRKSSPFPPGAWPKIVTIAGLAHHKGQLDGIRMISRLKGEYPRISYQLIGMARDLGYRSYLQRQIKALNLVDNVGILDAVPEDVKFDALRDSDLYLQPSHEEGFCIAYLEAAMLVPRLVGTRTGAIAEMAQGDGFARVVKPCDVQALTAATRELLQIKDVAGAVERRREVLTSKYSWDTYFQQHLAVYREVLAEIQLLRPVAQT